MRGLIIVVISLFVGAMFMLTFLHYVKYEGPPELTLEKWGEIVKSDKPVVILITSENCRVCHIYEPIFLNVAKEMRDQVDFYKLNYWGKAHDVALFLKVDKVPTTIIFRGKIIKKFVGIRQKEILTATVKRYVK